MHVRQRPLDGASNLEQLQSDDFIMDANVERVLTDYLEEEDGETPTAIAALAEGYHGRAQICNVLTGWLADLGCGDEGVASVEQSLAALLNRHFSPDEADGIFSAEGATVVEWLPKLVQHRRWRKVIYDLVQHFPQCLMLNFAVRLISDAGFQSEISNVNTATQQLEIFSRVMVAEMKVVVQGLVSGTATSAEVETALEELVRVVSQTEHTYLYTMALLETIARKAAATATTTTGKDGSRSGIEAAVAMYICQHIRGALQGKEHETTALRCGMLQSPDEQVPGHVLTSLITMVSKGQLNPADVSHVYQAYIMPRPPPVALIRDDAFIALLLDALFSFDKPRVSEEHRDKYIFLLAYACTITETAKKGQRTQSRVELDSARVSMERAVTATEAGIEDLTRELPELLRLTRVPAVAAGLLHFVRSLLLCESRLGEAPPAAFVLLDHVATTHPNIHRKCFTICCELYDKVSSDAEAAEVIMQRQRAVVDRFVHLFSVGAALPVLEKMGSMFADGSIDASIVRYFLIEVLEMISPPYSVELTRLLLPLASDTDIIDEAVREKTPAVAEFIAAAEAIIAETQAAGGSEEK